MSFGLHDLAAAAVGVLPVHSQPRGLDQLHRGVPGVAHRNKPDRPTAVA